MSFLKHHLMRLQLIGLHFHNPFYTLYTYYVYCITSLQSLVSYRPQLRDQHVFSDHHICVVLKHGRHVCTLGEYVTVLTCFMRLVAYVYSSPQIVICSCHLFCLLACHYKNWGCVGRCKNWLLEDFSALLILFIMEIMSC